KLYPGPMTCTNMHKQQFVVHLKRTDTTANVIIKYIIKSSLTRDSSRPKAESSSITGRPSPMAMFTVAVVEKDSCPLSLTAMTNNCFGSSSSANGLRVLISPQCNPMENKLCCALCPASASTATTLVTRYPLGAAKGTISSAMCTVD
uniref:Uncharacterized protein n=1 Tax=Astyanax mexicanus TaxID=7994 RepID=A0A3B1ICM6_ASTMX